MWIMMMQIYFFKFDASTGGIFNKHLQTVAEFARNLDFSPTEAFNLYHANFWVIGPATAGHGRGGCSYVELVATSAPAQRPLWFLGAELETM